MVGETTEDGEKIEPKLPEAKSVRQFAIILEDQAAMATFRAADGSLTKALARFDAEHPDEWLPHITSAESVLSTLSADSLRAMKEDEIETLTKLRKRIDRVLNDRKKLKGSK